MKGVKNISKYKHAIGMATGVVTALVILFSQVFYFDYAPETQSQVKTEQSQDQDGSETTDVTISQDAVSSIVQVNINQGLHFISDIHFSVTDLGDFEIVTIPDLNKYFKALFNLIISPNAP